MILKKEVAELLSFKRGVSFGIKSLFKRSAFAYSAAPGNDKEVTDELIGKVSQSLKNMLEKRMDMEGLGNLESYRSARDPVKKA